jgi:transcriptional regulator with XRE-family HTH domain
LLTALEHERPDLSEAAPVSSAALAAGDLVRRARLAKGMSQAELARLSGLQQSAVSTIERGDGKDGPTFRKLRDLAHALGATIALVPETEEQPRPSPQAVTTEDKAETLNAGSGDLERAIANFEEALSVVDCNYEPQRWAFIKTKLGEAHLLRAGGGGAASLEELPAAISEDLFASMARTLFAETKRSTSRIPARAHASYADEAEE